MGQYIIGTGVTITETFMVNGVPTDPTTVTFYLRDPQDQLTTYVFGVDPELSNPSVGVYVLSITPTLAGHYNYRAEGTGAVVAVCEGDFDILPSPTLETPQDVTQGPCTVWADAADVAVCCNAEVGSDVSVFESSVWQASQILYELSGRQFPGTCKLTVRPCGESLCGFQVLSRGFVIGPDWSTTWGWNGTGWTWPAFSGCGCAPLDRVLLSGYPVTSIVNVKVDGAIVDPNTYRLDEHRFLTRVRQLSTDDWVGWPSCQLFDLPDTQPGTFSVTYLYGANPPLAGESAAVQLACELYKACAGDIECVLPAGTTRATRQGLTIDKTATLQWFFNRTRRANGWSTGLSVVDAFLNAVNPFGVTRRPAIWSPSGPQYARRVGA